MKRTIIIVSLLAALLGLSGCAQANVNAESSPTAQPSEPAPENLETSTTAPATTEKPAFMSATFEIEGIFVPLVDGEAAVDAAPDSASRITTRYFGNEAYGDLNGDGKEDVAFLLTQNGGGSGTFFYVVAALQTESGYQGTNAILLGDRIAPQTTLIEDGKIIVNFAERKPDEPFTAQPSVGASKYLWVLDGKLVDNPKIGEVSARAGWAVKIPSWLPEGYTFQDATYLSNDQVVVLTFTATRQLPGDDPAMSETKMITLVEGTNNAVVPLKMASEADLQDITRNGEAAIYAVGAWDVDASTGTATWNNAYLLQNVYWQSGEVFFNLNTDDTLVSKEELLKMAESVK